MTAQRLRGMLGRSSPWLLLAIFCAIPALGVLARPVTGRLVWTVVIASLPAFIVVAGYHRWRRICPLYFFSRIPVLLGIQRGRRASKRLEANYYYVAFSLFFASLWLRLIATNGDGYAIALFFVAIAVLALATGFFFTGRTWCNYFCPLSFIEKIYTEPRGLTGSANSQCSTCTACKASCPDINQENGYWKEIGLPAKRIVYFAFPGLVLGFYLYFFLQAGDWAYYFSGRWTNEPATIATAFLPGRGAFTAGFYFLPQTPRALAAAATLAVCAGGSLLILLGAQRLAESWNRRRSMPAEPERLRHLLLSGAGFAAFVIFYTFAGQPTLKHLPGAANAAGVLAVMLATLVLVRRLARTPKDFIEETIARGIVRRWQWVDIQPPDDLREALLIHRARAGESERGYGRALEAYSEAVRETVAEGYVTPGQMSLLRGLRQQLQISDADQERLLTELEEEGHVLLNDPERQLQPEKRLQLASYARELEPHFAEATASPSDTSDAVMGHLRAQYRVTPDEHAAVVARLVGGGEALRRLAETEAGTIKRMAAASEAAASEASPLGSLLALIAVRERDRAAARLERYVGIPVDPHDTRPATTPMGTVATSTSAPRALGFEDALRILVFGPDPYGRAIALCALDRRGLTDEPTLRQALGDKHAIVVSTVDGLRSRRGPGDHRESPLLAVERMIALAGVPMLSMLEPEELATLAQACGQRDCGPAELLCREGERGSVVFVVLSGQLEVFRLRGAEELFLSREPTGAVVGEMAVLDSAPRAAAIRAGPDGARLLVLDGAAFASAARAEPAIASGIIASLARRLRSMAPAQDPS